MKTNKKYSEILKLETFDERFQYLKLNGGVGRPTFGFDRYTNQRFYASKEWNDIRNYVIYRDNGCDLGVLGYEIYVSPLIHHINVMVPEDIMHGEQWILDPEFLITTTKSTHNAIHFGSDVNTPPVIVERSCGDTKLW